MELNTNPVPASKPFPLLFSPIGMVAITLPAVISRIVITFLYQSEKAGHGSENKVPFIAAVQANTQNNPLYAVFSRVGTFTREEVVAWANRSLVQSVTVVSDGFKCFKAVTEIGCSQQREVVGPGRKSTDMECFTCVNTILGNLKTAINGTYHAFDFEKYAHRYLGEYQYRFNRRFDLASMFTRLVTATARTDKRPEGWLRLAGDQY